jgi:hypothetical protein
MISHEFDIHIDWEGPFTMKEVQRLKAASDRGLYQVYGHHAAYGSDVLLYIGKAARDAFGERIPRETWWADNRDAGQIKFYVGRLHGVRVPRKTDWERLIDRAERLLIFAHSPANNTQKGIARADRDLHQIHVFNYGHHRDLLPEVSGARWTSRLGDFADHRVYGTRPNRAMQRTAR